MKFCNQPSNETETLVGDRRIISIPKNANCEVKRTELYQCVRCEHLTEAPAGLEKVRCQDCDQQDYGATEATRLWNDSVARNRSPDLREVAMSFPTTTERTP